MFLVFVSVYVIVIIITQYRKSLQKYLTRHGFPWPALCSRDADAADRRVCLSLPMSASAAGRRSLTQENKRMELLEIERQMNEALSHQGRRLSKQEEFKRQVSRTDTNVQGPPLTRDGGVS